jgi:phospholipid/cholesterol/gamma-HCH transport system substrate-binding protein
LRGAQKTVDQVGAAAAQFGQTAQRLNAPGGPLDRVGEGTDALAHAAESFSATTLPRINRATDETSRTVRTLNRAVNELTENPQMLIYGEGPTQPGPGEPGFKVPGGRR